MSNYFVKTFHYNGLDWEYDSDTRFIIESGRYKNKYKAWSIHQDPKDAIEKYEALRVTQGYKKRLIMPFSNTLITLARFISPR